MTVSGKWLHHGCFTMRYTAHDKVGVILDLFFIVIICTGRCQQLLLNLAWVITKGDTINNFATFIFKKQT